MILIRIEELDVPQNAVFYLNDEEYLEILKELRREDQRIVVLGKVRLVEELYSIRRCEGFGRKMEEGVMAALAMVPSNFGQIQRIKFQAIKQFLKTQVVFLKESTLDKVSEYFSKRVHPQKQLKVVQDVILGTFIIQQITHNPHNNGQLRKFLTFYNKENVLVTLLDHITKHKNLNTINMVIELAQSLKKSEQIFKIFQENSQIFYQYFWKILDAHLQPQFKYFVNFMLGASSVRGVVLHQGLYGTDAVGRRKGKAGEAGVEGLLNGNCCEVYGLFRNNPEKIACQCLQYYIKKSNFHIPENKKKQTLFDPLAFAAVKKQFWTHEFHGKVINYSLWVLLERRIAKVNNMKLKPEESRNYTRSLFQALTHICIDSRMGTFLTYFPIEYNMLPDLLALQSLPTILYNSPNLPKLPWLPQYLTSQLPRILHLQNGYKLLLNILNHKFPSLTSPSPSSTCPQVQINYHLIFNIIEFDIINKRNNKYLLDNMEDIVGVLNFVGSRDQGLGRDKEVVGKLLRALALFQ